MSRNAESGRTVARVAAVQMHPQLGDVDANLEKAERWVRLAIGEGAEWVALPEFFTTGIAQHPARMVESPEPLEGRPMQLLRRLARDGGACVGGSYLARSGEDVYNTYVLALPDGSVFTHDKDFPTSEIESSVYAGGEDAAYVDELRRHATVELPAPIPSRSDNTTSGVFELPGDGPRVSAVMCWELVRYRTARRIAGRVDLVMAGSGWPFSSPGGLVTRPAGDPRAVRIEADESVREAPRRLARLVGAPVVHANLVGDIWSQPADGAARLLRFSGESQITDAHGATIARRPYGDGEGIVVADVALGAAAPSEAIPEDATWTSEGVAPGNHGWYTSGAAGREAYLTHTRVLRSQRAMAP